MGRTRTVMACSECGQPASQWTGRCPGCGAWGSIGERPRQGPPAALPRPLVAPAGYGRVSTGLPGVDRVLGGGLVPASAVLLAGEPGIGKSTLLLQVVANLSAAGLACLLASGEESLDQVAARADRLGLAGHSLSFVPGRDLTAVLEAARAARPFLLAVDSIQTIRDVGSTGLVGGPTQVRTCTDALVGLAKEDGVAVLLTGHVTKEGDLAGPRTLEHAVDVVLSFDGDARSGLRLLAGGKNRFGPEGEVAWFEMGGRGLSETDPGSLLAPGGGEPGSATALPMAGRRALAVEVQALAVPAEGPARRQVTGLDLRRFTLTAAVVDRAGIRLGRSELYGAASGGIRVDDPGADLAVAAALASAVTGRPSPPASAFVGEVGLTGLIRPVPGVEQRLSAAAARGIATVFAPVDEGSAGGVRIVPVRDVRSALAWARGARAVSSGSEDIPAGRRAAPPGAARASAALPG